MPEQDFNFILNPAKPQKKTLLPTGGSTKSKILVVAGGAIFLIIIAVVVMSLLSSSGKGQAELLLKASQQQAELIRVSEIGVVKSRDVATRNLAVTTSMTLQSDQAGLTAISKAKPKEIALGKNAKTDATLTAAEQSNKFDEVFSQTLKVQLLAYQKTLKSVYDGTEGKKTKATLAEQYQHMNLLVGTKQ